MGSYPITDYYAEFVEKNPEASQKEALQAVCSEFDIPNLFYLRVVGDTPFDPRTTIIGTYSDSWNERYQAKQYYFIDPLIQLSMTSDENSLWSSIPRDAEEVRNFFAEAAEYNIPDSGILIPLDLTRPGCAILSVNTNFTEDEWKTGKDDFVADMTRLGQLLHQSVLDKCDDQEVSATLMPSETELLQWISNGRTRHEISLLTGTAMESIDVDLANARKKLAASTLEEAVEIAILRKLIS
jgi:DNA-binding CsgD family transcriptional regulator